jgi:competence protein ComEC
VTVLLTAAAIMVIISPGALASLSFQLSLLATVGVLLAAQFTEPLSPRAQLVTQPLLTTVFAGLATAPVIAMHFGTFTPAMIPANLLAGPLAAPATMLGALVVAASPIPLLADMIGWCGSGVCGALLGIARFCATLPGGQFTFAPIGSAISVAIYAFAIVVVAAILPEGRAAGRQLYAWVASEPVPATVSIAVTIAGLSAAAILT